MRCLATHKQNVDLGLRTPIIRRELVCFPFLPRHLLPMDHLLRVMQPYVVPAEDRRERAIQTLQLNPPVLFRRTLLCDSVRPVPSSRPTLKAFQDFTDPSTVGGWISVLKLAWDP
jgi:hypothetical protein